MASAHTFRRSGPSAPSALQGAGLHYVEADAPGLRRERRGRGFRYVDAQGRPVRDAETLERIRMLAIPPAYRQVWICADPCGHLQATGIDARGRKQYRYHPQWRLLRDQAKFARMAAFAEALPRLRQRLRRDLARSGLPRAKVLAAVVALLDATRSRIGNDEYARDNGSYGLTTLRRRHAEPRGAVLQLRFTGKGGAAHALRVVDRRLSRIVRRCQQLPGQRLFQYLDAAGRRHAIDSGQVNDYLREAMGGDFTAKDFRTWGATLQALALLAATPLPEHSERQCRACVLQTVRAVAESLRNTPAVCRKSYINPQVFEAWREGRVYQRLRLDLVRAPRRAEQIALRFLRRRAGQHPAQPPRRARGP